MHPLVFALLLVALVLFILGCVPALTGGRYQLWVSAALSAVVGILLHLFMFHGGA